MAATDLKVDMKHAPVLQIYSKLQNEYMQICWQQQEE